MALQQMPIMDRMFTGTTIQRAGMLKPGEVGAFPFQISKELFRYLAGFKRVMLDDDQRIAGGTGDWNISKEFGHLMLPFPHMWVEWNNTRGQKDGHKDVWMAAMCIHQSELEAFSELWFTPTWHKTFKVYGNSWIAMSFMLHGDSVVMPPTILLVDLDEKGMLVGARGVDLLQPNQDVAENTALAVDLFWDALVAIGWMNCRNVSTEHHDRSANLSGSKSKRARNLARSLDFHTIKLPHSSNRGSESGAGESRELRLHHVRGHFKTFTAESPLMGQHVGTYWWGWQVRGNKKNGVVVADYKVGV